MTPSEVAERYGVSPDKVIAWIRAGELRAMNIATRPGGRPRYAIDETDLLAFEVRRQVHTPAKRSGRRRGRASGDVIEFF
jgi:excisionase family DNA binding protein